MEKHTRQNTSHSSTGDGVRFTPRGGSALSMKELMAYWASIEERAELENLGISWSDCWCQGELCNSTKSGAKREWDWVGRDEGLPHPHNREELDKRIKERDVNEQ